MRRRARGPEVPPVRLRVDPVACDGIGICAHLAPDLIGVDSWGYPVPSADALDSRARRTAERAARACPRQALFLVQAPGRAQDSPRVR